MFFDRTLKFMLFVRVMVVEISERFSMDLLIYYLWLLFLYQVIMVHSKTLTLKFSIY